MPAIIIIDPDIDNDRPAIKGTRISAQTVLQFLGAGNTIGDLLEPYPSLMREDVLARLRYASRHTGHHFA